MRPVIQTQDQLPLPQLAASSYLNTAPLIWSFLHGSRINEVRLVDAVPSRCSELLASAAVDAALVPVIEYQRIEGISVVPGICVGSRERVRSVVLASKKKELKDVHSIALDESSRTSSALIKITFREFFGTEPQWTQVAPDLKRMLQENDAALIIGDPAMMFDRGELHVFDMANLWRQCTGLGFVFAMWMVRDDAVGRCNEIQFQAARDEGMQRIEEIADVYSEQLRQPRESLLTYLRENITFRTDDDLLSGLDLYYRLAAKHELIPKLKPINWFSQQLTSAQS